MQLVANSSNPTSELNIFSSSNPCALLYRATVLVDLLFGCSRSSLLPQHVSSMPMKGVDFGSYFLGDEIPSRNDSDIALLNPAGALASTPLLKEYEFVQNECITFSQPPVGNTALKDFVKWKRWKPYCISEGLVPQVLSFACHHHAWMLRTTCDLTGIYTFDPMLVSVEDESMNVECTYGRQCVHSLQLLKEYSVMNHEFCCGPYSQRCNLFQDQKLYFSSSLL